MVSARKRRDEPAPAAASRGCRAIGFCLVEVAVVDVVVSVTASGAIGEAGRAGDHDRRSRRIGRANVRVAQSDARFAQGREGRVAASEEFIRSNDRRVAGSERVDRWKSWCCRVEPASRDVGVGGAVGRV